MCSWKMDGMKSVMSEAGRLHTGGSGSQNVRGQTYMSPRVLGFQVGDILAVDISVGEVS